MRTCYQPTRPFFGKGGKFIKGDVYRATLVGHKVAAVCMREAPNIAGDGIRAIAELIKTKNEHPWRGEAHPDNIALFEKISRLCDTSLIGLDFICQDISRTHYQQKCAVLEANSLPYIDMHHYPTTGQPHNVAGLVMDYVLGDKMALNKALIQKPLTFS